jgi:hypothetical protein
VGSAKPVISDQDWTSKLGWEVNLNAMPGDCDLERLASNYNISLSRFQFVSSYFRRRRQSKEAADLYVRNDESFGVCLEEVIARNPGSSPMMLNNPNSSL